MMHNDERDAYIAALNTFVNAATALSAAYETEHFNADEEFSDIDYDVSTLFTCSLDEWVLELMSYRDSVLDR